MTLHGKIAVVAGATRGAGRGIAIELGAAGATVYCTGRSTRGQPSDLGRAETIDDTADQVTAAGGVGIAVRVDHTDEAQVQALFERIASEQGGRLDILVNDIWGGEKLIEWGKPFWELSIDKARLLIERAILTHMITSRYGVPLMIPQNRGLVIEITDGEDLTYRGQLLYDFLKTGVIRLAHNMAQDLKDTAITAVSLTPGFLRSEEMLDHFGVTETTWRDAIASEPYFAESETPHYIGRAVVALASDRDHRVYHGQALSTWGLSERYPFNDVDGRRPHWKRFFKAKQSEGTP